MKTKYVILFVLLGLLFYAAGIALGGDGMAMLISLFGGCVMMIGLFPALDKYYKKKEAKKQSKQKVRA